MVKALSISSPICLKQPPSTIRDTSTCFLIQVLSENSKTTSLKLSDTSTCFLIQVLSENTPVQKENGYHSVLFGLIFKTNAACSSEVGDEGMKDNSETNLDNINAIFVHLQGLSLYTAYFGRHWHHFSSVSHKVMQVCQVTVTHVRQRPLVSQNQSATTHHLVRLSQAQSEQLPSSGVSSWS